MSDSKKRRQHIQKSKGQSHDTFYGDRYKTVFDGLFSLSLYAVRFPLACKKEARWMFGHLDLNFDGYLSLQELYELEHDQVSP